MLAARYISKTGQAQTVRGEKRSPVSNELLIFAKSLTMLFLLVFYFCFLFHLQMEDFHEICNFGNCFGLNTRRICGE